MTTFDLIRAKLAEAILGKPIPHLEVPRSEVKFTSACTVNAAAVLLRDANEGSAQVRASIDSLVGEVVLDISKDKRSLGSIYLTREEAKKLALILLDPTELV